MRVISAIAALICATVSLTLPVFAGCSDYEITHPPRTITQPAAEAVSYFIEISARHEKEGYGHSFVTLGFVDASSQRRKAIVAGFLPKSHEDDCLSLYGIPVRGIVGVVKSDFAQEPSVRFRAVISRAQYHHALRVIALTRRKWTEYQLLSRNCNSFTGLIARSVGLRAPASDAQLSEPFVSELRALNVRFAR